MTSYEIKLADPLICYERPGFFNIRQIAAPVGRCLHLDMLKMKMKIEIADIVAATGLPQRIVEQLNNKDNER